MNSAAKMRAWRQRNPERERDTRLRSQEARRLRRDRATPCLLCGTRASGDFKKGMRLVCASCTPDGHKWCSGCRAMKSVAEFSTQTSGRFSGKLGSQCRACGTSAGLRWAERNPVRRRETATSHARKQRRNPTSRAVAVGLISNALARARDFGLPFDDSDEFREQIVARVAAGRCEVTGLAFSNRASVKQQKPFRPSLDRIVSERGYMPGNVRVVCWAVNAAIGSWGLDVAREVAAALVARVPRSEPTLTVEPSWHWQ